MVKKKGYENQCREQRGSKANETEKEAERSRREEGESQDRKRKMQGNKQTAAEKGKQ